MKTLRLVSYNIHKGFSHFNRRLIIHELREQLHRLDPDIALLQEVQGLHLGHANQHPHWPSLPQHEFLAEQRWHAAYGGNASYAHGHHGNAILSRYPITHAHNHDVTQHRLERRGLLHSEIPYQGKTLHLICVHLSLTHAQRRRQLQHLSRLIHQGIPANAPLIVAGDFNDWQHRAPQHFDEPGLIEAFTTLHGRPAKSFPSRLPVFALDRIYLRGFRVRSAEVHSGPRWARLSDHAPLSITVEALA